MQAWEPVFRSLRPQHLPSTATPPPSSGVVRIPTDDFRSLLVRAAGEPTFPTRRNLSLPKDDLLTLYSHALTLRATGAPPPPAALKALAAKATARMHAAYTRLLADPLVPPPRKDALRAELDEATSAAAAAVGSWCAASAAATPFAAVAPTLARFLAADSAGQATYSTAPDTSNTAGRATEARAIPLLRASLPPGADVLANVTITHVDGRPLRQRAGCKAELDAVVVDAGGTVRCVVEVKTARRNPVATLWDDYAKLAAAVEGVRGRAVAGTMPGAGAGAGAARRVAVEGLRVAGDVAVVYIMGSETDDAAVEAGFRQVRTAHVGRVLAGGAAAWGDVALEGVHGGWVALRVPPQWLADADSELLRFLAGACGRVHLYFL